jgi:hypothetical protein
MTTMRRDASAESSTNPAFSVECPSPLLGSAHSILRMGRWIGREKSSKGKNGCAGFACYCRRPDAPAHRLRNWSAPADLWQAAAGFGRQPVPTGMETARTEFRYRFMLMLLGGGHDEVDASPLLQTNLQRMAVPSLEEDRPKALSSAATTPLRSSRLANHELASTTYTCIFMSCAPPIAPRSSSRIQRLFTDIRLVELILRTGLCSMTLTFESYAKEPTFSRSYSNFGKPTTIFPQHVHRPYGRPDAEPIPYRRVYFIPYSFSCRSCINKTARCYWLGRPTIEKQNNNLARAIL